MLPPVEHPLVSVIVPAYREAGFIEACVGSALAQEIDGGLEVIVADGSSPDGTAELARAAGATVVDNPARSIPAGLNAAARAARGEFLVRLDAHAEMPPGYVAACLRALAEEPGAVNVGGWLQLRTETPWGAAVAAALASPAGVGGARRWRQPRPGEGRVDVESVPFGCYRTADVRAAGGWREDLLTNEDFELNHRLRVRGGRVVFDPVVHAVYRPRETLHALACQYWRYGMWKAAMLRIAPESLRPRQLAPVTLVAALAAAPFLRPARGALLAYALLVAGVAARSPAGWRTAPVLATMHLAWGAGLVRGLARPPRPQASLATPSSGRAGSARSSV